jgi:hypothetical protein
MTRQGTAKTILYVQEATALTAISLNFDFICSGKLSFDDLTANGGRSLFSTAIVGTERAIDVVIAHDARLEAEVL